MDSCTLIALNMSVGLSTSGDGYDFIMLSFYLDAVAAEGDAVVVAFNYRENKKVPIPDAVRQRILDVEKTIF